MRESSWPAEDEEVASDAALVVAFREQGRNAAYGELVRRYQIPVFRLLLGILDEGDEAEDSCEDVFVKAARDITDLGEPAHFYPWVIGRAQSLAVGEASQRGTMVAPDSDAMLPSLPAEQLKGAVQSALKSMPPDERAVLMFAELHQSSAEEIAQTLGRPLEEVEQLIVRARRHFLDSLGDPKQSQPAQAAQSLEPGALLDKRFRIKRLIGAGGMGNVYLAEHLGLKRDVAIKVMLPNSSAHEEMRARFRREALLLGKLEHANFVEVNDFGETADGTLFLALEFLSGRGLADWIDDGVLSPTEALRITRHVLRGLQHMHAQEVVHRDIKPDNIILVEQDGDPLFAKILDLGIARLVTAGSSESPNPKITQAHLVVGTPAYIAPEQATSSDVDGRADLYSLTVVLFEMLSGTLPFDANSPAMLMAKHIASKPPALSAMDLSFQPSEALEALVARGLAKRPVKRFANAQAYLTQLERMLPSSEGGSGELSPIG